MRQNSILAFLYFIIFIGTSELCAQHEQFSVHFDKPFYITGQTIWYKIYNTNYNSSETHSQVVYVNVHDRTGKLITQQKHRLADGQSHGALTIPRHWKEDYYYITCFTQWNLQFDTGQCYVRKMAIYNSLEFHETAQMEDTTELNIVSPENHRLAMDKQNYKRREDVKVVINGSDIKGYSVAVITLEESRAGLQIQHHIPNFDFPTYATEFAYEKENEIILRANIIDPSTNLPLEADALLLYKTNSASFLRVSSKGGSINSPLGWIEGSTEYQLINMNPFQAATPAITPYIPGNSLIIPDEIDAIPQRTPAIERYIRNEKIRMKVDELFNQNSTEKFAPTLFSPIPFKSDKVYLMEKYKGMKNLEDFFREIVYFADMNSKNGQTTISLKNSETQLFFMEKPWYLVDGKLTRDEAALLSIPFKNLLRIDIFNTTKSIFSQLDPLMIRSGLVVVYTNGDVPGKFSGLTFNSFLAQGLSSNNEYVLVEESTSSKSHENPQFRSPVYWNPGITPDPASVITFPATDDPGDFIILVEGILESGEYWKESMTFKVSY